MYLPARHASSEFALQECVMEIVRGARNVHIHGTTQKKQAGYIVYTAPGSKYPDLFGEIFTYCKSTKRQKAYFYNELLWCFTGGMHEESDLWQDSHFRPPIFGVRKSQFCGMKNSINDVRSCDLGELWRVWRVLKFWDGFSNQSRLIHPWWDSTTFFDSNRNAAPTYHFLKHMPQLLF